MAAMRGGKRARVFESPTNRDSIVRHRFGHATHMHVRFENPTAELTARRSYALLQKAGLVPGGKRKRVNRVPPRRAPVTVESPVAEIAEP